MTAGVCVLHTGHQQLTLPSVHCVKRDNQSYCFVMNADVWHGNEPALTTQLIRIYALNILETCFLNKTT